MTHNSFLLEAELHLMYLHHSRKPGTVRECPDDRCRQPDQSQDTTNIDMTHNSFLLEAALPLMYLHHSRKPGTVRECPQTVGF